MQIKPILAALRRHRLATLLIALEIALACAVLCNASFLISGRLQAMHVDTGVDQHALAFISLSGVDPDQADDLNARVLSGLRAVPGVQAATVVSNLPFTTRQGRFGVTLDAAHQHFGTVVDSYVGSPGTVELMGLKLVQGRLPDASEYQEMRNFLPEDSPILVTRALAQKLWPGQEPLGKELWCDHFHMRVIGVLDRLVIPEPGSLGPGADQRAIFVPGRPGPGFFGTYAIKADPAQLGRVLRDARAKVASVAPEAVLELDQSRTLDDLREAYFRGDRAMTGMLLGVIVALLLVTALGIVGLTSFWVAQRRKQIGVRRALGATRRDILRYFQTENFLIVSLGILLGVVLAFGMNLLLMSRYELPRLPLEYVPLGALALWLLGQAAVLAPALRAASVPPVVATRSV